MTFTSDTGLYNLVHMGGVLASGIRLTSLLFPAEVKMGRKVMVIVADFTKDNIYGHIKETIQGLEIAVLGLFASTYPMQTTLLKHLIVWNKGLI